jgi:hypothetical protein
MSIKKSRSSKLVSKVVGTKLSGGGIKWHLSSHGKFRTLKTSKSSMRAMEEATRTFSTALARLADR